MLEAITLMQSSEWLHSQLLRVPPVRRTTEVPSIEAASDGYVGITMVTGQQWLDFLAMVDCPELTEIQQLRFQIGRWGYRDLIREQIGPWLPNGPSRRSSNSANCSGCRSRRWATAPRSARWNTYRARGLRGQPGRLSPAPPAVADVGVRARADADSAGLGEPNDESPWQQGNPTRPGTPRRGHWQACGSST